MPTLTKKAKSSTALTKKVIVKRVPRAKKSLVIAEGNAPVYTMAGEDAGTIALPEALFGAPWKPDLVHQVVTGMQANARPIVAHTKNRGEVRGGGKKPWKQKGTGRARHGSIRSPLWKGGGVTFGPRKERIFEVKINRRMRAAALASVLSRKWKDGEVIFVDQLAFAAPKTKEAKKALAAIAKAAKIAGLVEKKANAAVIAFASKDANAEKSLRNIGNVLVEEARNLNPVMLMTHRYLVIERPAESLATLSTRLAK